MKCQMKHLTCINMRKRKAFCVFCIFAWVNDLFFYDIHYLLSSFWALLVFECDFLLNNDRESCFMQQGLFVSSVHRSVCVCVWGDKRHLSFSLCLLVWLHLLHSSLFFPECVCVSVSLPVSCALFQGLGLRHTFHLAYEALILFRAWRKEGGREKRREERERGMLGVDEGNISLLSSASLFSLHFSCPIQET